MPIIRPFSQSQKYRARYIVIGTTAFDLEANSKTTIYHKNNNTGFIPYSNEQLKAIHARYWKLKLREKNNHKKYQEE